MGTDPAVERLVDIMPDIKFSKEEKKSSDPKFSFTFDKS